MVPYFGERKIRMIGFVSLETGIRRNKGPVPAMLTVILDPPGRWCCFPDLTDPVWVSRGETKVFRVAPFGHAVLRGVQCTGMIRDHISSSMSTNPCVSVL